jgi:dipeptidase E
MRLCLGSGGLSTDARRRAWVETLDAFLGPIRSVLYVPHALEDHDKYLDWMSRTGFAAGRALVGLHKEADPVAAVDRADAVYVGGGNTFRLLADLERLGVLDALRRRVLSGTPYVGISAGTNLACPSIRTTNDMPIVWPRSPDALDLVPFQINPHYVPGAFYQREVDWYVRYGGETRDDRLREFHERNDVPILALREGAILLVEGPRATVVGPAGARLFRRGLPPDDFPAGADVSALLAPAS